MTQPQTGQDAYYEEEEEGEGGAWTPPPLGTPPLQPRTYQPPPTGGTGGYSYSSYGTGGGLAQYAESAGMEATAPALWPEYHSTPGARSARLQIQRRATDGRLQDLGYLAPDATLSTLIAAYPAAGEYHIIPVDPHGGSMLRGGQAIVRNVAPDHPALRGPVAPAGGYAPGGYGGGGGLDNNVALLLQQQNEALREQLARTAAEAQQAREIAAQALERAATERMAFAEQGTGKVMELSDRVLQFHYQQTEQARVQEQARSDSQATILVASMNQQMAAMQQMFAGFAGMQEAAREREREAARLEEKNRQERERAAAQERKEEAERIAKAEAALMKQQAELAKAEIERQAAAHRATLEQSQAHAQAMLALVKESAQAKNPLNALGSVIDMGASIAPLAVPILTKLFGGDAAPQGIVGTLGSLAEKFIDMQTKIAVAQTAGPAAAAALDGPEGEEDEGEEMQIPIPPGLPPEQIPAYIAHVQQQMAMQAAAAAGQPVPAGLLPAPAGPAMPFGQLQPQPQAAMVGGNPWAKEQPGLPITQGGNVGPGGQAAPFPGQAPAVPPLPVPAIVPAAPAAAAPGLPEYNGKPAPHERAEVRKVAAEKQKAARGAIRELVGTLAATPPEGWTAAITGVLMGAAGPAIYAYVVAASIRDAIIEAGASAEVAEQVIAAIDATGLVPAKVPRR